MKQKKPDITHLERIAVFLGAMAQIASFALQLQQPGSPASNSQPAPASSFPTLLLQILPLVALLLAGVGLGWTIFQSFRRGAKGITLILEGKWFLAVFAVIVLSDLVWLTGWYVVFQKWLQTSMEVPNALTSFAVLIVLVLIVALAIVARLKTREKRIDIYDDASVREFSRLTQVTVEQDSMWQRQIKELESQHDQKVNEIESKLNMYRGWWLRTVGGILRLQGLPEAKADLFRDDDLGLKEYALDVIKDWEHKQVQKAFYYDYAYPSSFVSNLEQARDFFINNGFRVVNAGELATWMLDCIRNDTAHKCIVVFAQDVVPETVVEAQNPTCILRRFLDKGGRVVWRGDIPLFYLGLYTGAQDRLQEKGASEILGVSYENVRVRSEFAKDGRLWDGRFPVEITQGGRDIGLTQLGAPRRPVPVKQVDMVYSRLSVQVEIEPVDYAGRQVLDGYYACCWKKNYNSTYPHSGFLQYYLGEWDGSSPQEFDAFFRFAVSGWPLTYFTAPQMVL